MKKTCPCCGYKTLTAESYDICDICFWEDCGVTTGPDPDYQGAANCVSLRQAQKNFIAFGAIRELWISKVRKPNENDVKDPNFNYLANERF